MLKKNIHCDCREEKELIKLATTPAFLKEKSLDILLLSLAVKMRQVTFPPPSGEEETEEEGRVALPQWGGKRGMLQIP